MPKITAIKQQERNKDRVSVFVDGEFALGVDAALARDLQVGQTWNEETMARLQDEEAFNRARESAFRYLGYRPRSIAEVRRNLRGKDFEETLVEGVISYLLEHDYLDDEAFAAYWVEQREAFKPRSRRALRHELYQKGVDRSVIDEAIEDVDETAAAQRAAERRAGRWSHLPYKEFEKKLNGYLRRRGFTYRIARATTERAWQQLTDEE
jgi:regulatory protein